VTYHLFFLATRSRGAICLLYTGVQAAVEFKEKLAIGPSNVVDTAGAAVKVANKYSYMANAKTETVGAADGEQCLCLLVTCHRPAQQCPI
jgi:hypothetical protein